MTILGLFVCYIYSAESAYYSLITIDVYAELRSFTSGSNLAVPIYPGCAWDLLLFE